MVRCGLLAIAALVVAGCAVKANVSVADLESLFPVLERHAAYVYMLDDGNPETACEYFEYRRGAFNSDPADEFCRVFRFHPGGGDKGPVPVAFDDEARKDLADLKREFDRVGVPIDYINVVFDVDGSVASRSQFSADGCVEYWYEPGGTTLPDDAPKAITTVIDDEWYKIDHCP